MHGHLERVWDERSAIGRQTGPVKQQESLANANVKRATTVHV